jgi:hypothetical protein
MGRRADSAGCRADWVAVLGHDGVQLGHGRPGTDRAVTPPCQDDPVRIHAIPDGSVHQAYGYRLDHPVAARDVGSHLGARRFAFNLMLAHIEQLLRARRVLAELAVRQGATAEPLVPPPKRRPHESTPAARLDHQPPTSSPPPRKRPRHQKEAHEDRTIRHC